MRGRKRKAGCCSSSTIPRWSRVGWGVTAKRLHLWTRFWRAKLSAENMASGRPSAPHPLPLRRESALGFPKRSEEHTSELQSRLHLVCRLLLEKKKKTVLTERTMIYST